MPKRSTLREESETCLVCAILKDLPSARSLAAWTMPKAWPPRICPVLSRLAWDRGIYDCAGNLSIRGGRFRPRCFAFVLSRPSKV